MGMPNGNTVDFAANYRSYYAQLGSEEAKLRFLLMLKERRDLRGDKVAAVLLPELMESWVTSFWMEP